MDRYRVRTITLVIAASLIGLGVGLATGIFENDDPEPETTPVVSPAAGTPPGPRGDSEEEGVAKDPDPRLPPAESDPEGLEPGPSGPAPSTDDETAAASAARAYVEAIDDRRGRAVCGAFAPGGLSGIDLPAMRGSCSSSVEASLGFRGRDGQPVWDRSQMTQDVSALIEGDSARVVATVLTEYADVREPTVEDDIIYLTRSGDRWLVVKPSSTLYRAVGIADVPLAAFQPPS